MWVRCNPNPDHKHVPDCMIRALCIALNRTWEEIYDDLADLGRKEHDVMNHDPVWGKYLYQKGFEPFLLPNTCPKCLTIRLFCQMYPRGIYIIGTGSHAVAVIDRDYYDSWDSGNEIPSFFWRIT